MIHQTRSNVTDRPCAETVPKEEFSKSGEIAASVFFTTVFRSRGAETALNVLVLLSAFGNLLAVLIGSSRMIREIGR